MLFRSEETAELGGMGSEVPPMPGSNLPPAELGDGGELPSELAQSDAVVGGAKPAGRAKR